MPRENFLRDIEAPIVTAQSGVELSEFPCTSSDGHPYPSGTFGCIAPAGAAVPLYFRLDRDDVTVANGTTILSANVGTAAGRWRFLFAGVGTSGMVVFDTLADAAAAPGPAVNTYGWIGETDAPYEFVVGDATAANDWTVIAPTGGTAGRWILRSDSISIESIDNGVSDDTARLQLAVNACAYSTKIYLRDSVWLFPPQGIAIGGVLLPSGTHIIGSPGVIMRSTQTRGAFLAFIFYTLPILDNGLGVLASAVSLGGNTISTSISYPAGTKVWVGQTPPAAGGSTYVAQMFTVISVAGVGPFTLTLDRPVEQPFPINTRVQIVTTSYEDIIIDGNDMVFEGEADRLIQLQGVHRGYVRDIIGRKWTGGGLSPDYVLSLDLGCFDYHCENVRAYDTVIAAAMESTERCTWHGFSGRLLATGGYRIRDSIVFEVNECSMSGYNTAGATGGDVRASDVGTIGSISGRVRGGRLTGSGGTTVGLGLSLARDIEIDGVACDNHQYNFSEATTTVRCRYNNTLSERAGTAGYLVVQPNPTFNAPSSNADARPMRIEANVIEMDIVNPQFDAYTVAGIRIEAPSAVLINVTGGQIASTINGPNCIDMAGASTTRLRFKNTRLGAVGAALIFARADSGVCILEDVSLLQLAGACVGYQSGGANCTLRRYGSIINTCATPYTIFAGSFQNVGTFNVNGVAGGNVAFPDLKAGEVPKALRTTAGAPNGHLTFTITPGTGFAWVSDNAGDNGVFTYTI